MPNGNNGTDEVESVPESVLTHRDGGGDRPARLNELSISSRIVLNPPQDVREIRGVTWARYSTDKAGKQG
jgi:hypothetical protein